MVLRSQTLFSLYCCVSLLATQAAYAKTVEIGSGDTRIVHLSKTGKATSYKRYKRYHNRRRVQKSRTARRRPNATDSGTMVSAVQTEAEAPHPGHQSDSSHTKKVKNPIAVVTPMKLKLSTTPAPAVKAPKTLPKAATAVPISGSVHIDLKQTAPAQKVAALNANKAPVTVPAADPASPRGIYEQYVKEIKADKGFENVMPVYASEKKKQQIAKLLSSPKSKKFAIGFIEAAAKCTDRTFMDAKTEGNKATLHYSGVDTCSPNNKAKMTETIAMVKENGSWKINMISAKMTDVVKIDVTKPKAK